MDNKSHGTPHHPQGNAPKSPQQAGKPAGQPNATAAKPGQQQAQRPDQGKSAPGKGQTR